MSEYITNGTCSTKIHFEIKDGIIHNVSFDGGCNGNLKAVSALVEGMDVEKLLPKIKGLHCGRRKTSCCDQLACAIEKHREDSLKS